MTVEKSWNDLSTIEKSEKLKQLHDLGFFKTTKGNSAPTSAQVLKQITSTGIQVTPEQAQHDKDSLTADDYDDWVWQAIFDLLQKRIHVGEDGKTVEHPIVRLHRIGQESIREKKASQLYLSLKELLQDGFKLPNISQRAMLTAQKRLDISNSYRAFLRTVSPSTNLKDAKKTFRIEQERALNPPSQASIDDALERHHINWSAYDIDAARKGKRTKKK